MGDIYQLRPESVQAPSMEQAIVYDRLNEINAAANELTASIGGIKNASYPTAA